MAKRTWLIAILLGCLAIVAWLIWPSPTLTQVTDDNFGHVISQDPSGFERVLSPRKFEFPQDHGAHDRYRTEWWYFTGNLKNPNGRQFGYELTFFRFALSPPTATPAKSTWRNKQLYMAHLTLTDAVAQKFYVAERFSRAGNGLAGASDKKFQVWLNDWSVSSENGPGFPLHLKAKNGEIALDLHLSSQFDPVLQGNQGLSQKSTEPGNASYYYSYPRLATEGSIGIGNNQFSVTGNSWMDREWSTSALADDQQGWDWFALQLDDGSALMFYQLRRKDGQPDSHSSGSAISAENSKTELTGQDVNIKVLNFWTSPASKVTYPAAWHLSIPGQLLELDVQPLLNGQELNVSYRYWEGAVTVTGQKNGKAITGQGYVELAGYK